MLYLLDANSLITPNNLYYPLDRVPQFWEWLELQAHLGLVTIPLEVHAEIVAGSDALKDWLSDRDRLNSFLLDEEVDPVALNSVLEQGYAPDLTDVELDKILTDAFLIAYALDHPDRTVVTKEESKPRAQGANRKIPDVCRAFGVRCMNDFEMLRALDFSLAR
ncbi:MAG: DUF4411 family protein [Rhodospirillaceae bacterium]